MTRLHEVAAGVLVATSGTDALNSVVVLGQSGGALLIDPGWQADELDDLARELSGRAVKPVAGFATHAHHDHLLWHPDFGDVPRWASPDTVRIAGSHRNELLIELGDGYRPEVLALTGRVTALPGLDIPWPGPEAGIVIHDAHIVGHSAVWIAELGLLVAGDMLSDVELPLPDDSPSALAAYGAGLETLAPYASIAALVIPGHGSITTEGAGRMDADRRYLDDLAAGRDSTDARIANPGMADIHAKNRALAEAS
jgi:glyoxylase-like metal-dependent hydrolase (beta-lactamase superfamily II)